MKTQARIFTIRARLALIALGVLATMLAMSGAAWFGFSEYRRGQIAIAGLDGADGHLQQLLRGLAEFVITEGTGTSAQIVAKSVAAFRAEWETLPTTLADYPEVQEQLAARAQPLWEALRTGAGKLTVLEEGEVSTDDAAAMVLFGRTLQVGDKLGATLDTTRQEVADRALARASSTARALVGGLAVAFAVVVLLLAALYVSIVKPVTGLARVASRVARGDFSQHLTLKRGDEIGALADAFRSMGENLRRTIGALQELATEVSGRLEAASEEASRTRLQISDSVGDQQRSIARTLATCEEMHQEMAEVAAATESLTVYAQQSAAASSEISASIRSVAEQAELHHQAATVAGDVTGQMIGSLDAVAENLQELTSASQQIAAGASQMMATTDDTARQARESAGIVRTVSEITTTRGAQAITDALEGMDVIERSVTTLVEVLDNLGEHSGEIGRVVGVIRDVADQTGLLALNAAILAAQAGERGRGFAVVADEVKDLAARTSDSTEEVEEMIAAIQAKTQESVAQARAGLETVGHGKQQVRALAKVLTEIRDQSVAAAKNSDTIVRAASEQSDVAGQIAAAIHSMSDRLVNVSQRAEGMEAQSRGLRGEMEKIREGARSVKTATAAQLLASEQIAETSHGVAEHATQIMQSIRVQQEGSQHVSAAMVPIDRTAEQLVTRVAGMDRTVTALVDQAEALIEGIRRFTV